MRFLDEVQTNVSGAKQDSVFIKLGDGDSVVGVFSGEPEHAKVKFDNATSKWVKDESGFRFRLNLVVEDQGVLTAKIFENGAMVYTQLRELNNTGYSLPDIKVKITRKGLKMDTVYTVLPIPHGELNPEDKRKYAMVPLKDLK